jgi:NNP family nitrate/nitrite transporter-like MFS transporter
MKPKEGKTVAERQAVVAPQGNTTVLALATLSFAACFAVWALYSPLAVRMREELHLSETQLSLLVSIPALLGSAFRVPMGILTDMYGGRKVFTVLMVFCFFPTFLAMYAGSYTMLLICGFLFGMSGTSFAIGVPHVSRWYPPEKQGMALGVYGIGNMGAALATLLGPRIIHNYLNDQWHYIFPIYATPLLLMAFLYWNYAIDAPTAAKPRAFSELLQVYKKTPLAWVFCLFYWVTFGGFVCFSLYLPAYFGKVYKISPVSAGDLATVFIFTTSLIRVVGGYLADRMAGRKILLVLYTVAAGCLILIGMQPALNVAVMAFILLGLCFGIGNGVIFKLVPTYFARDTGAIGGLVGAAGGLGGFFTPIILGTSKDLTGSYFGGFAVAASFCLICLFLARKEFQRVES